MEKKKDCCGGCEWYGQPVSGSGWCLRHDILMDEEEEACTLFERKDREGGEDGE